MKKSFTSMLAAMAVITTAVFSTFSAHAQQPLCIKTQVLNINTGIDNNDAKINFVSGTQDPFWSISAQTGSGPTGVTIGGQAFITTNSVMAASPNSSLLSYSPTGGNDFGGYITTPNDTSFGAFSLTFRRTFKTCRPDTLRFDFDMAYDNYLVSIVIDGVPVPGAVSPLTSAPGYYMWGNIFTTSMWLGAGAHTIDVRIGNEYATYMNPTSLNIIGSVTGTTSSLVANNSPEDCDCNNGCEDLCYWKVRGNNILNGNNIFGTLSKDDVQIKTSSADRGIFTADGRFGWNLMNPSTLLHILCDGRFKEPSDVRIEQLPVGTGRILVVDDQGYVYQSDHHAKTLPGTEEMDQLKKEIALLKEQVALLTKEKGLNNTPDVFIYPNPAKTNLDVQLMNADSRKATTFIIVDMQGKTILSTPFAPAGDGQVMHVDITTLAPGIYIGNIMSKDQTIARKKFTVQK